MAFTKLRQFFSDTAEDIATRGFAEFFGDFALSNANGRELYKSANEVIEKRLTFASFLTNKTIREGVTSKGLSGPEIEKAIDEFRSARATRDIGIATEAAKRLDAKHGTTAFMDLLNSAKEEASVVIKKSGEPSTKKILLGPPDIDAYKGAGLQEVYMNPDGEEKIRNIVKNFAGDKMESVSNAIYKVNGVRNYLKNEDPALNRKRAIGVAGAYTVGALGVRAVQGGTPLRNEYGETDIAGVPFL